MNLVIVQVMLSTISQVSGFVGSLCLLLFGMEMLSNGIQKGAGNNLHSLLRKISGNRFTAVLMGMAVTAIIQSSGATTVMVVSFVNAEIINLTQAIGIIFGANIGTTVTAWIVSFFGFSFSIEAAAIPLFGFGFILKYFKKHKIAGLTLSTQLGIEMLKSYKLPLRYLLLGGSKMIQVPVGHTKVINGYGPTEFTVCSSFYILEQDEQHDNIPIGRPVPNSISVIVDKEGRLVPHGTVGELCLIGRQMSRGYWKQEELTKKRFVDCSFLKGQKMYRTGDLVRWNEEGLLEYIGRIDNQVKLHGYRIELEEIENKMTQCPGVVSAAVVVHKQGSIEYIVGYYTSEGNQDLPDIQETLMAELPSYMVPSQLIRIDQMPLTPNGKIDYKALPAPMMEHTEAVKPETTIEMQVFDIISEQLNTESLGVTDNLIFYGLSSLIAMRLGVLLQRRFNVNVKMGNIMKTPTIRAIASLIAKAKGSHLPVYEPRPFYPLMENQRGLYLEWEKAPQTTQYNIPFVYSFEGIDADRMVQALKQTVNAHPYLKSKLMEEKGEVVLQRNDSDPVEIKVSELNEEPDSAYFQKRVLPFHLLGDQLYRLEVLKMAHKTYLFFDFRLYALRTASPGQREDEKSREVDG